MKKLILSLCTAATLTLLSGAASAASFTGYVCQVFQYNYSGFGTYGGFLVRFYTGPNCTGSYAYTGYVCTTGGTSGSCPSSSYNVYSEAQMLNLFQAAADSARAGTAINYITTASCKSGGTDCLESMYFRGN